jgi:hypothetical protein
MAPYILLTIQDKGNYGPIQTEREDSIPSEWQQNKNRLKHFNNGLNRGFYARTYH